MSRPTRISICILTALTLATVACGDEHEEDHEHEELSAEAEACEHVEEGPFETVQASEESTGELPDANLEHTWLTIETATVAGGRGGFVQYEVSEAGDYAFFLSDGVPLEFTASDGTVVMRKSSELGNDFCDTIAVQEVFHLEVGTYTVELGPTDETAFSMVSERIGEGHD